MKAANNALLSMPASRPTHKSQRTGGHGQQCHRSWQSEKKKTKQDSEKKNQKLTISFHQTQLP